MLGSLIVLILESIVVFCGTSSILIIILFFILLPEKKEAVKIIKYYNTLSYDGVRDIEGLRIKLPEIDLSGRVGFCLKYLKYLPFLNIHFKLLQENLGMHKAFIIKCKSSSKYIFEVSPQEIYDQRNYLLTYFFIIELVTCIDKTKYKELLKRWKADDQYPKKYYKESIPELY